MPPLSRRYARPLLKTIGGQVRATQDDHVEQIPTPPSTDGRRSSANGSHKMDEQDVTRSPESSEDEASAHTTTGSVFKIARPLDDAFEGAPQPPSFKHTPSFTPDSVTSKQSQVVDARSSDSDSIVFGEQRHNKRQKRFGLSNIHAPPRKEKVFGKKQRRGGQISSSQGSLKTSRSENTKLQDNTPARTEFRVAKGADAFEIETKATPAEFRVARRDADFNNPNAESTVSLSPSLSLRSSTRNSPEVAELPNSSAFLRNECAICGDQIDILLREAFESQFSQGRAMLNYKWQQRFCRWHRVHDAERLRVERGYPEIKWDRLERRMSRHKAHLKDVIGGVKPSHFRDQLRQSISEGSKTTTQALRADGSKKGALVGYYGPRGERAMTEHIIVHLSDVLREQAAKDKLVVAAGLSGGVPGFVQAVLVPELAEQLIMEDMKISSERAREVISESAELGDLLHPDVDDKVIEVAEV